MLCILMVLAIFLPSLAIGEKVAPNKVAPRTSKSKRIASLPKILIIGDSISGGYSKSLIKLLDGKAEVIKLGSVVGYRIQKEAFWHSRGTAKSLDFGSAKACIADLERFEKHLSETKYDVIHFNFGLNDIFRGRKGSWHNPVNQYAKDLTKIVTLLKKNGAKVIWASTTPIPMNDPYRPEGDDLIYNAAAEKVMKKNNIPINDLHSVVTNWDGYDKWRKGNNVHFGGGVYSKLAKQIAEKIFAQLETPVKAAPRTGKSKRGKQKILPVNAKILQVAGHTGFLALPENVKVGQKTPWLWYFPSDYNLPGKLEQWMINKCLANGIAVAGINLMGDFGTPAGRAIFTAFYKELTDNHGLTKKVCMLARSYGGTQMYNWAAEHPESVACLAGIYPVCNMESYPGLKSASRKYGMSQEQFIKELKNHNPIDRLAPLAKAKVPIYHNHGDIDTLVPPKENSTLLAERYKALGGNITITVFKGQGHNYWPGYFQDEAMAAFIIKHAKKIACLPKVLFFGDSISGGYSKSLIKFLDGKADVTKLGSVAGYRIKKQPLWQGKPAGYLNFGNAMMCVSDFDRFKRHLSEIRYDVIHFNFGLNDIFRGRNGTWHSPPEEYAEYLSKIVALLKTNGAKIIWANTTPIPANAPHMPEGDELIYNAAAEKVMKNSNIPINDLHSVVTNWDGYGEWKKGNNVHFSGAVYSKMAKQVAEQISAQLEAKHLFILSGQSNMVGLAPSLTFIPTVVSAFGKSNIIVVKDAHSGQSIRSWCKSNHEYPPPTAGRVPKVRGLLYDSLIKKVHAAIEGKIIQTITFVWMQGESDLNNTAYDAYLKELLKQLQEDLEFKDINFVIGRISDNGLDVQKRLEGRKYIRKTQVQFAKSYRHRAWVDTDDLNDRKQGDKVVNDLHYTAQGYELLGQRFAEQAVRLIRKAGQP